MSFWTARVWLRMRMYACNLVGIFCVGIYSATVYICLKCVVFFAWLHDVNCLAVAGAQQSSGSGDKVPSPKPAPRKSLQPAQGNQTCAQVTVCCRMTVSHRAAVFYVGIYVVVCSCPSLFLHDVNCSAAAGSEQSSGSGDRVPPPRPPPPRMQPPAQGWFWIVTKPLPVSD